MAADDAEVMKTRPARHSSAIDPSNSEFSKVPTMKTPLCSILGWLLPALLVGCSHTSAVPEGTGGASARVTGTITYLQRMALPSSAVIRVQLVDVSRADAPATVLAEQVITAGGKQVPFAFEIPYDPSKLDQRYSYAVQARIEDGGKLLFINDQRYAVITRGAPNHVDMVLRAVGPSK
jgi:putative lipoprotein